MVLRQDLSEQVQVEASLTRRTEEVAQAASMLSARAARDLGTGGRGNAWGDWRRGGRGEGLGGRGRGSGGRRNDRPEVGDYAARFEPVGLARRKVQYSADVVVVGAVVDVLRRLRTQAECSCWLWEVGVRCPRPCPPLGTRDM